MYLVTNEYLPRWSTIHFFLNLSSRDDNGVPIKVDVERILWLDPKCYDLLHGRAQSLVNGSDYMLE